MKTTLVCPDNDPESRLILLIAYKLGMCVIRSGQSLGATLERERGDLAELIRAAGNREVWIVEIPGSQIEAQLREEGFTVVIIDHHTYKELNRSLDAQGNQLPSSLEQFLTLLDLDDEALCAMGLDPVVVRGIAIMDARFVQGLRVAGYTHEQIRRVLDFRRQCVRAGFPDFDKAEEAGFRAWERREQLGEYIVVRSHDDEISIRGAIATLTIYHNCDTQPLVIADKDEAEIFVQNVDPSVIDRLQTAFAKQAHTFTFGSGRCWGLNNARGNTNITLQDILRVIS